MTEVTIKNAVYEDGVWTLEVFIEGPNGTYSGQQLVDGKENNTETTLKKAVLAAWGITE